MLLKSISQSFGCPSGVIAKFLDSNLEINEFELRSRDNVHFCMAKDLSPLIPHVMG